MRAHRHTYTQSPACDRRPAGIAMPTGRELQRRLRSAGGHWQQMTGSILLSPALLLPRTPTRHTTMLCRLSPSHSDVHVRQRERERVSLQNRNSLPLTLTREMRSDPGYKDVRPCTLSHGACSYAQLDAEIRQFPRRFLQPAFYGNKKKLAQSACRTSLADRRSSPLPDALAERRARRDDHSLSLSPSAGDAR